MDYSMPNYNPYSFNPNPYQQQNYVQRQQSQGMNTLVWVNGREGANAYPVPPNSAVILLNSQKDSIFIKTTDGGGYATVKEYPLGTEVSQNAPTTPAIDTTTFVQQEDFNALQNEFVGLKKSVDKLLEALGSDV